MCLSTHVVVRVWASSLCEYGQSCWYVGRCIFVHVTVYLLMRRHVYVYLYDCFISAHIAFVCTL